MCEKINTEITFLCPDKKCPYYQDPANKITKDGVYTTKSDSTPRQMFKCHGGNHRFSETRYSDLFGKQGSFYEYEMVAKMCSCKLSSGQIADIIGRDVRTIEQWVEAIGKKSKEFHIFLCITIGLNLLFVQMDELWSYLKSKKHQLWVFATLDVPTKFWINFEVGSRTNNTASNLVQKLKLFGNWNEGKVLKITTDKLAAYKNALSKHLTDIPYKYLQIVKKRFKRRLITVKKCFVKGGEKDFPPGTQNTSFIERFNLTLRQHVPYLTRKTLGYCKKKTNFNRILWINLYNYNYVQFHKSLRVKISTKKNLQNTTNIIPLL
jgi:IS1 family transposase/transposase-like protein